MSLLKRVTSSDVAEPPPGTFSQCLVAGETIYVSGQHAGTDDGGVGGDGSMLSQATIALGKIKALIEAAGGAMADIAKLTVYVTDISGRGVGMDAVRSFIEDINGTFAVRVEEPNSTVLKSVPAHFVIILPENRFQRIDVPLSALTTQVA